MDVLRSRCAEELLAALGELSQLMEQLIVTCVARVAEAVAEAVDEVVDSAC